MNASDWLDADTRELFRLFQEHDVRYLIVGGLAVNYHGYPRNTVDTDIFYERSPDNTRRLFEALREFWGGSVPAVQNHEELLEKGIFFQFGRAPNRIDLMNEIPGVDFPEAWENRVDERLRTDPPIRLLFISKQDLIRAKEAADRDIDRADLKYLKGNADD